MKKGYLITISAMLSLSLFFFFASRRLENGPVSEKVRKAVWRTAFSFSQQPFMRSFPGERDPLVF